MSIFSDVIIIIISILIIARGAIWLVDSAVLVARHLGISDLVIGLTVVAMGTSAPEFGVTLLAASRGMTDISVGNIVGSNIFNLGFILGGTAAIQGLKTSSKVVYRDGAFLLSGTILLTLFLWNLTLERWEGIILFGLLFVYLGYLYWKKESVEIETDKERMRWIDPLLLLVGIALVLSGSHFLVDSAVRLARVVGISEWVIGATIVAAGTSAPEMATSLTAVMRGQHGISVGNLIGSDIFNVFGVLGLAAMMRNLPVDIGAQSNMIMLIGMVLIVIIFMRTGWKVSRWQGLVLVCLGLARWIYSF
ncbi:calcium/sodium antiporter [Candidatus Neomarinimicrobiota bacterium]